MDTATEAQTLSTLAFNGDRCGLQEQMLHIPRREMADVMQAAQAAADKRTADSGILPVVNFRHSSGLVDRDEVERVGGDKNNFRETLNTMIRGDISLYMSDCKKK